MVKLLRQEIAYRVKTKALVIWVVVKEDQASGFIVNRPFGAEEGLCLFVFPEIKHRMKGFGTIFGLGFDD